MFVNYLFSLFVFIFGLCIGSFLNCFIYRRLPASAEGFGEAGEEKSMSGRSFCPNCKHELSWLDLFPVFSYLFLGGKCRYCRKKISWQYPLVELATGLIFFLIFNFQLSIFNEFSITQFLNLAFLFYIASSLIVIFVYDFKHYLIPDKVLFPAIIITFVFRILEFLNLEFVSDFGFRISDFKNLFSYLIAIIIAAGFFLTIFLVSRGKWMGFGDVKLAILMGLLLGFPNILVALFLAFFFGAIIGVILMAMQRKGLKSEIPFGPFLILGTFLAMFWGSQIISWYFKFLI